MLIVTHGIARLPDTFHFTFISELQELNRTVSLGLDRSFCKWVNKFLIILPKDPRYLGTRQVALGSETMR